MGVNWAILMYSHTAFDYSNGKGTFTVFQDKGSFALYDVLMALVQGMFMQLCFPMFVSNLLIMVKEVTLN